MDMTIFVDSKIHEKLGSQFKLKAGNAFISSSISNDEFVCPPCYFNAPQCDICKELYYLS